MQKADWKSKKIQDATDRAIEIYLDDPRDVKSVRQAAFFASEACGVSYEDVVDALLRRAVNGERVKGFLQEAEPIVRYFGVRDVPGFVGPYGANKMQVPPQLTWDADDLMEKLGSSGCYELTTE
jgi:hypothetical protein